MKPAFKKTKEEQISASRWFFWLSLIILTISIWHLFSTHNQIPTDVTAANYENIIQAHVMSFRLKVATGLFALGSIASYGLTYVLTHLPLGRQIFEWSSTKDDSNTKAAKVLALGLVLSGSLIGIFTLLANVIGK